MAPAAAMARTLRAGLRRLPPWTLYAAFGGWSLWQLGLAASGAFIDPVAQLQQRFGVMALQLLVLVLAVTPLRRWLGVNLLRYRRALALTAFALSLAHVVLWAGLDAQTSARIVSEIAGRPFLAVGLAALALMLPLALTASDAAIRRMGVEPWRRLHRLTYVAVLLAVLHFLMARKGWQLEPLLWLAVALALLLARLPPRRRASARP